MYLDSLTTAAVADELRQRLLGGRVQRVVLVDDLSLGLEVFAGERYQLLASAEPQHPRVYLADFKLRRGVEKVTPLLLLARKYLEGARLTGVEQPAFERLVRLDFASVQGQVSLLMELIERRANLVLLQGGRILDCAHRVGPEVNRFRTVLPGQPYRPPPPQDKLDPTDVTELHLRRLLQGATPDRMVWQVLVDGIAGVSPLFARQVVFAATRDPQTRVAACDRVSPLLDAFEEALIPYWEHQWQPCVVLDADGAVTAFAPYPLTHLGRFEPVASISVAIGRYYGALLGSEPYQKAKEPLEKAIKAARQKVGRRRESLARRAPDPTGLEALRRQGELVLAYAATITRGQTQLQAHYEPDEPPLIVPLDPRLSPVANAQAFFRKYEKAKRASAGVPELLAAADLELAYLEQLSADLDLATNWPEIDEVGQALAAAGFSQPPPSSRPRGSAGQPLRVVSDDGLLILVGRNSRQNDEVTFKRAAPDDLWLHARGVPGGHVVVKSGGKPVPTLTLLQAARLAAGYSSARNETDVPVDVVSRKQVRRVKGGGAKPGMVTYTGEETLRVVPQQVDAD